MQFILRHLKALLNSVTTPPSVMLGILLGVLMGLPHYIWLFVVLGWIVIPLNLALLLMGNSRSALLHPIDAGGFASPWWVVWVLWGIVFLYGLLFFTFGWCSNQVIQRTGIRWYGIFHALWTALVMLLSAILPATFTMLLVSQNSLSYLFFYLTSSITLCGMLLVPLCIMALLAGFVGEIIYRRSLENRDTR